MLELKLTRRMFALGLFVVLSTYNLAYANTTINGATTAPAVKEQPKKLNEDPSTKTTTTNATPKTAPSDKKKTSPRKPSTSAVNGCACSGTAATGRAAKGRVPYWDCTKGCLRSWGVSPIQLTMCAGTCAFGMIPLCAICVGVSVSVVMLCMIGCGVYAEGYGTSDGHEPILTRKTPRKMGRNTEHRVLAFAGQH